MAQSQDLPLSSGAIALRDVSRLFRAGDVEVTALDAVSLRIAAGSAVAISGPSGSGKSTLLHLIGALDRPDGGEIVVDGTDVAGLRGRALAAYRRRVGFVFQRFNLIGALTALGNVTAPVLPHRTPFDKSARGRELLGAVGLGGREQQMPAKLSGGEQQRVAIARALINGPALVLADEPTGNLDSRTGDAIIELLVGLRDRHGITVVIATHDVAVASRCDRVVRVVDGHITDDVDVSAASDLSATMGRLSRVGPR